MINLNKQSLPIGQKGYVIKVVLIAFALLIGIMIFPIKFPLPPSDNGGGDNSYCGDILTNGKTITVPSSGLSYRMIKLSVPVADYVRNEQSAYHHYGRSEDFTDPETGKKYVIRYLAEGAGRSYKFASTIDPSLPYDLAFADYGIIMVFEVDDRGELTRNELAPFVIADIYKRVDAPELPEWVLKCQDLPLDPGLTEGLKLMQGATEARLIKPSSVFVPDQEKSNTKDQLQLEWFLFEKSKYINHNWWTPHCKPAVYLYPERNQIVNVKVNPLGELGYTDPLYEKGKGWTVSAGPDGDLVALDNKIIKNGYLYYESRIRDEVIKKPTKGWVVKYDELERLFNRTLPQLGLNVKEEKDFKDYWLKALPESSYYFVGLVDKAQRDYLERLEVTPNPDTSIRFSFYFEPLNEFKVVEEPVITTPVREGFTLVDWGGMIKLHKDTLFTCSQ